MVCNPKSLMNVPDFLKTLMNVPDFLKKYTSASRKRVTHTQQMKLRDKQKKSNQHVWVDGFLLARKFCERTPSKPSKSVQNPSKASKTLGTGPYTGRDARVRFSWRPLPSNRADFLKKYTSASRKRVTHTEQMKLRDKQKKSNQNVWVDGFLLARKFCEHTPSKPSKSVQNPSKAVKTLGTGPYTVRDARVRFSGRPQSSNVADCSRFP